MNLRNSDETDHDFLSSDIKKKSFQNGINEEKNMFTLIIRKQQIFFFVVAYHY